MITCSNCGASFQENMAKCPYCGQIYIPGAEKEYLDNLREIKDDMSEIEELSEEMYQSEIRKNAKKTGVIVSCLVILLLLGIGLFVGINHLFSYGESEEEIKERMLWERENFPVLDAWYEEREYQKIIDFMEVNYEEKGYSFYEWEHHRFIEQFENYQICMEIRERIVNREEVSEFDAGELLYCGMSIINYENASYDMETYSDTEKEMLNQWRQEIEEIFSRELQYTQEEMQELQSSLYKEGYLSYDACCEEREAVLEKIQDMKN